MPEACLADGPVPTPLLGSFGSRAAYPARPTHVRARAQLSTNRVICLSHQGGGMARVKVLMSETPKEVERSDRIQALLRHYRNQQFSHFEWNEIETFVNELERTQPSYEELAKRIEEYVTDVSRPRARSYQCC